MAPVLQRKGLGPRNEKQESQDYNGAKPLTSQGTRMPSLTLPTLTGHSLCISGVLEREMRRGQVVPVVTLSNTGAGGGQKPKGANKRLLQQGLESILENQNQQEINRD